MIAPVMPDRAGDAWEKDLRATGDGTGTRVFAPGSPLPPSGLSGDLTGKSWEERPGEAIVGLSRHRG